MIQKKTGKQPFKIVPFIMFKQMRINLYPQEKTAT